MPRRLNENRLHKPWHRMCNAGGFMLDLCATCWISEHLLPHMFMFRKAAAYRTKSRRSHQLSLSNELDLTNAWAVETRLAEPACTTRGTELAAEHTQNANELRLILHDPASERQEVCCRQVAGRYASDIAGLGALRGLFSASEAGTGDVQ